MQGQVSDLDRARARMQRRPDNLQQLRPDILAILNAAHDGGRWTSVAYFASEAEARQRESQEPPPDFTELMKDGDAQRPRDHVLRPPSGLGRLTAVRGASVNDRPELTYTVGVITTRPLTGAAAISPAGSTKQAAP
jgi:hypothetical protein